MLISVDKYLNKKLVKLKYYYKPKHYLQSNYKLVIFFNHLYTFLTQRLY